MDAMNPITFVGFDHNATTIPKKSSSDIIDSLEKVYFVIFNLNRFFGKGLFL